MTKEQNARTPDGSSRPPDDQPCEPRAKEATCSLPCELVTVSSGGAEGGQTGPGWDDPSAKQWKRHVCLMLTGHSQSSETEDPASCCGSRHC